MIYIVRHGQTDYNINGRYGGRLDIPLNDKVIEEAYELKEKLKDIDFDIVYSSPLKRAVQTANIITDKELILDDRIIERNNGLLEGKLKSEVEQVDFNNPDEKRYNIENIIDFRNRINNSYDIGFYIKDMKDNIFKYNENITFETASCIKVFILVEYFKQIYENKIKTNEYFDYSVEDNIPGLNSGIISSFDYGLKLTSKDYIVLMIVYSDNIATNKLIKLLGIANINKTIKKLGFNNTYLFNELNLPKYLKFGQTTPYEYAKIYEMILKNEVINEEVSKNCLEILKLQKHNDMIIKYLPTTDLIFKGTDNSNIKYIASKSGSIVWVSDEIKNIRNDGGIVSTKYGDYIISIFISNLDDLRYNFDNKGIEIGGCISKLVYDNFIENKGELK